MYHFYISTVQVSSPHVVSSSRYFILHSFQDIVTNELLIWINVVKWRDEYFQVPLRTSTSRISCSKLQLFLSHFQKNSNFEVICNPDFSLWFPQTLHALSWGYASCWRQASPTQLHAGWQAVISSSYGSCILRLIVVWLFREFLQLCYLLRRDIKIIDIMAASRQFDDRECTEVTSHLENINSFHDLWLFFPMFAIYYWHHCHILVECLLKTSFSLMLFLAPSLILACQLYIHLALTSIRLSTFKMALLT